MTVYRTGYGTGAYGVEAYGVDGSAFDASASVSCVGVASASGDRIRTVSANITPTLAFASEIGKARAGSASLSFNAIFTASATLKWQPVAVTPETWTEVA